LESVIKPSYFQVGNITRIHKRDVKYGRDFITSFVIRVITMKIRSRAIWTSIFLHISISVQLYYAVRFFVPRGLMSGGLVTVILFSSEIYHSDKVCLIVPARH